ncbi:undecaprenyl-diphosphatase [Kribbella orskensis]|uniref:Undecaprenyl-diphosphatase n=1 Tax=Kribbella orskensis TaxID=2512216 RepID=A0ABY2BBC0_9ACTN|nr:MULTISPECIES: phosphatase PAP2 family protein [Kribbella]TCN31694.1 undecaprenyl-diphosphatase [Kribbella sp. VKM Ac-2500]TCO12300.1 undecaprenyl-diphosphatase [Kribbella orskensis]
MTRLAPPDPVEERLADRLSARYGNGGPSTMVWVLRKLGKVDREVYRAVAELPTPWLDTPLRRVSGFANFSKPWFLVAAVLALFGGAKGRRAAVTGVAAIGVTSFVVNQPMKLAGERRRPQRTHLGVPEKRWVRMPSSASFPSGHSASAAAFGVAVGAALPQLKVPLRGAAAVVAFSRVYTGVHYPADVVAGASVGVVLGGLTAKVAARLAARRAVSS